MGPRTKQSIDAKINRIINVLFNIQNPMRFHTRSELVRMLCHIWQVDKGCSFMSSSMVSNYYCFWFRIVYELAYRAIYVSGSKLHRWNTMFLQIWPNFHRYHYYFLWIGQIMKACLSCWLDFYARVCFIFLPVWST